MNPDLSVPAAALDAWSKSFQHLDANAIAIHRVAVALEKIYSHAADTGGMPAVELGISGVCLRHNNAAQPVGVARQCIEHCAVVGAARAACYQHATRQAEPVQMTDEHVAGKLVGCVTAVFRQWESGERAEHVGMAVARTCRQRKNGLLDGVERRKARATHCAAPASVGFELAGVGKHLGARFFLFQGCQPFARRGGLPRAAD